MTSPQDFNQTIRELLEVVRTSDLGQVAQLSELQEQVAQITQAIRPAIVSGQRMQAGLQPMDEAEGETFGRAFVNPNEHFPYSPVLGANNPISPLADFTVEDGQVRGTVTLGDVYNGPPGSVHGGIVALVMDELLGCSCLAGGYGGYTGTLSIRYQGLVPLRTEVELHGWVDRIEGRKIFALGEIRLGDVVLTKAEGVFIRPKGMGNQG